MMCEAIGAVAIIDDALHYADQCAGHLETVRVLGPMSCPVLNRQVVSNKLIQLCRPAPSCSILPQGHPLWRVRMEPARGPQASCTGMLVAATATLDFDWPLMSNSGNVSDNCIVQVKRAKTWTEAVEQLKPLVLKNGGI